MRDPGSGTGRERRTGNQVDQGYWTTGSLGPLKTLMSVSKLRTLWEIRVWEGRVSGVSRISIKHSMRDTWRRRKNVRAVCICMNPFTF